MLETRILGRRFRARRVDQPHQHTGCSNAARVANTGGRILRGEQVAGGGRRRRAGDDELVCRKARSLVGLEHTIAERILFRELEVRLHVREIHVHELRIGIAFGGQLAAGRHEIRSAPSILPPSYMTTNELWL